MATLKNNGKSASVFLTFLLITIIVMPTNLPAGEERFTDDIVSLSVSPEILTSDTSDFLDEDCENAEVFVDDILSPPSRGMTGSYNITALFSSVRIIVNGLYDSEENEPWVEHHDSPDHNGTPHVTFYTSCDEFYNYLAFENNEEGIYVIEIFVDRNNNGIWDEGDGLYTAVHPEERLRINYGSYIPDSKVAWGTSNTFVELQIPKDSFWDSCNNWAFRVCSTPCGQIGDCIVSVPPDGVYMTAKYPGTNAYFDITLSEVPIGFDVQNIMYLGWCIQTGIYMNTSTIPIYLYSSYCPPIYLTHENWSNVNYILNNKKSAGKTDIQTAIWHFINIGGGTVPDPSPVALQLIQDAIENGTDFVPTGGDVVAVICDPLMVPGGSQHSIIEVPVPECICDSWNPSWGDNTADEIPPNGGFMEFICNYDDIYVCECGVAFKALADIFEILPGEIVTLYSTDFEDANDTLEWESISLDAMPDTWTISTSRSHSSSKSFHCTNNSQYYGNSFDILQMKNGVDLSNVNNVTFSFWHWCQGDTYDYNGNSIIADYGYVEIYSKMTGEWEWISLSDLSLSNLYYDNDWIKVNIMIDSNSIYSYHGMNYTGSDILSDRTRFRFVWQSDPQFNYEGWYIDDVQIVVGKPPSYNLTWQSHYVYWCLPFDSEIIRTFPRLWNVEKEGEYLIRVCLQEEPPWCGQSCFEKIVKIGNIHDVAVIDIDPPVIIEPGTDVPIDATIKNVGTYDEENIQVKATLRKNGVGDPVWQRVVTIPQLNVSEEKKVYFTWENALYCDYLLEITAILAEDQVPENNTMSKWFLVATTVFTDDMDEDVHWDHFDLTGGAGHWTLCDSGYDKYLWCGDLTTTKYGNNWNDVATIKNIFNFSSKTQILLNFSTYCEIDTNDFGFVEISPDDGRHWYVVKQFTGKLNWTDVSINLSSYRYSQVKIRFRFYSNESIVWRGWIINDVKVASDGVVSFFDDFENGLGNWTIERLRAGDWWQRVVKPTLEDSGNIAYWCGDELSGMYPKNLDNALVLKSSHKIDLRKAFEANLMFTTIYNISEGDRGTVEISDDNGAHWFILDTFEGAIDEWTTYSYEIDDWIGGDILIRFRFVSDAYHESEGWYVDDVKILAKLDYDPPVTNISLSGTMGSNDWYTSSVQITLTADDGVSGSGVKHTYYKIDGGAQMTYTSTVTVATEGVHTIEYWSVDNVDNVESVHTISFKIDVTKPVVEITKPDGGIFYRDRKLWPLINWSFFNWSKTFIFKHITIEVSASDAVSGVDRVEFSIDGTVKEVVSTAPYEWTWNERAFRTHDISVTVFDKAGNAAQASREVWIYNFKLFGGT